MFGVTRQRVRYWRKIGLLPPCVDGGKQGYSFQDVVKQMEQTAEGLASVAPVLQLAREADVYMPIVEQVKMVLDGTMNPRDIAPHLTTDDDTPQGERTNLGEADRGGALWRAIERALDQFRHGGRGTDRD